MSEVLNKDTVDVKSVDNLLEPNKMNLDVLKSEIRVMFKFAVNSGKELPLNMDLDNETDYGVLVSGYNSLRKVIDPANSRSIQYIESQMVRIEDSNKWYLIPIFTKCLVIAVIALIALISVSLLPEVNKINQSQGLLEGSGLILLYNLIFICAASLLGVMFYLLKSIGDKIKNYNLLPVDSIELNSAIIIGIISGFVITELFPFTIAGLDNDYIEIQKMTLALLGGFSSDAIFSILQGVVNKFKGILTN